MVLRCIASTADNHGMLFCSEATRQPRSECSFVCPPFFSGCSRTVPGKDIINPDAELGGDLVTEKDVGINACCRACRIMTFLGLNCKAVVWNTRNTCFYKTVNGLLVHPGKGTAQEGGAVTVGFP